MLPCSHAVHSLSSHSRSLVDVSSTDSYCAAVHVVCDAQVPHPLCASVGATFMYSVPEHTFTAEHSRLTDADGTRVSHVTPYAHALRDIGVPNETVEIITEEPIAKEQTEDITKEITMENPEKEVDYGKMLLVGFLFLIGIIAVVILFAST